jgi:uncharacterized lipoprotein NlpE involved in copper resistance
MKKQNPKIDSKIWLIVAAAVILVAAIEAAHHLPEHGPSVEGTYSGVTPCADCEGIRETLELAGGKYTLKLEYLGKKGGYFVERGKYKVGRGTIALEGGAESSSYKLAGGDALLKLDMDGKPIESAFNYVLVRK